MGPPSNQALRIIRRALLVNSAAPGDRSVTVQCLVVSRSAAGKGALSDCHRGALLRAAIQR